ncbi:response regulator [bacterium]|nr:response regulator [bacterium]
MSILLIEDDTIHIKLIKRALEKAGYGDTIICLEDGEQAFRYLFPEDARERSPLPRLVLLDINIPKISGIEVLKRIKGDGMLRNIPVVMLSTSKNRNDMETCFRFCANSYVCKPLDFKDFETKIKNIVIYWLEVNDVMDE